MYWNLVILKLRNSWADISPPQESPQKEQQRNGRADTSILNGPVRVPLSRNRWWKLELYALLNRTLSRNSSRGRRRRRIRSTQSRAESRLTANREVLQRWGPWRKQILTCPQIQHPSWILVGGGRIYLSAPELDKVHDTEAPVKEQRHPRVQKQNLPPTRQVEAGEVDKDAHDEVEEQRIQLEGSQSWGEKTSEATLDFRGTLREWLGENHKQPRRQNHP